MALETEIAWAAGLFEGEGCIHVEKYWVTQGGEERYRIGLTVTSTDKDVLDRFQKIVNCGKVYEVNRNTPSFRDTWKTSYYWGVGRRQDVLCVIDLLLPWLGNRRRGKIEEGLSLAEHWRDKELSHSQLHS